MTMQHVSTFELDDGFRVKIGPKLWLHGGAPTCEVVFSVGVRQTRAWNGALHNGSYETVRVRVAKDVGATAELWDGRKWNPMASIPPALCTTGADKPKRTPSVYDDILSKPPTFDDVRDDVRAVLAEVRVILGSHLTSTGDAWQGIRPAFTAVL